MAHSPLLDLNCLVLFPSLMLDKDDLHEDQNDGYMMNCNDDFVWLFMPISNKVDVPFLPDDIKKRSADLKICL